MLKNTVHFQHNVIPQILLLATCLKYNLSKFQLHPTIIGVSPPIQISSHKNLVFHSLTMGELTGCVACLQLTESWCLRYVVMFKKKVKSFFKNKNFDLIIHLAAFSGVQEFNKNILKSFNNNVLATKNLVEFAFKKKH